MRYRADFRTFAFIGIYFALVAIQFVYRPAMLGVGLPLLLATCWFSFVGAVATHNTLHSPVFKKRWLNRAFQCVLTLTYGHPVSAYVPGHNLSHHKHIQTRKDLMRTTKMRFRWNLLNYLFFMPTVSKAILPADMRYFKMMRKHHGPWYRQTLWEWGALGLYVGVMLFIDWKSFLIYGLLPHQFAAFGIVSMNYLQHDGCDTESDYNHSRNFVGKVLNYLTLNNGYHAVHHMEPGLHWSLLPAEHEKRVKPFIHPALDQASIVLYMWRAFGWPGKRLRYDGEPVVLPEEGPDEEWIPAPDKIPADVGLGAMG
ncbi:MAG: fatty acid desaturase [Labilithrix sp.]|nr:fatty acid desaturase [Labilithrix sp.]